MSKPFPQTISSPIWRIFPPSNPAANRHRSSLAQLGTITEPQRIHPGITQFCMECMSIGGLVRAGNAKEIGIGRGEPYTCSMTDRIVIDSKICHGKPVIRGTRLPVSIVVGSLAGGMSFEDVAREYRISEDDIKAALEYAAELTEDQQHQPLVAKP